MDRNEAVLELIKVARISEAYANDLYDSFFEKPVVPQCVADWYEEHKGDYDYELWDYLTSWDRQEDDDFKDWIREGKKQPIITLVSMHLFGYEVEKETKYIVKIKELRESQSYLNCNASHSNWFLSDDEEFEAIYTHHTRKELEANGFGWVFDCEGVEVKEVKDE